MTPPIAQNTAIREYLYLVWTAPAIVVPYRCGESHLDSSIEDDAENASTGGAD